PFIPGCFSFFSFFSFGGGFLGNGPHARACSVDSFRFGFLCVVETFLGWVLLRPVGDMIKNEKGLDLLGGCVESAIAMGVCSACILRTSEYVRLQNLRLIL